MTDKVLIKRKGRWVNRQWIPEGGQKTEPKPQSNPNFDPNVRRLFNMNKKAIEEVFNG